MKLEGIGKIQAVTQVLYTAQTIRIITWISAKDYWILRSKMEKQPVIFVQSHQMCSLSRRGDDLLVAGYWSDTHLNRPFDIIL
jgi:hypothetical protein